MSIPVYSKTKSLKVSLTTEKVEADPLLAKGYQQFQVLGLTLDTLVSFDRSGKLFGVIAKKWNYDPKSFSYEFEISEKATFEDGSRVTAKDIVFSFMRHIDSKTSVIREYLQGILADQNAISAEGDEKVTFRLKKPYAPFFSLIAFQGFGIISHKSSENRVISSGIYRFKENSDSKVCVEKRQNYSLRNVSSPSEFCFLIERDVDRTIDGLRAGAIDIAMGAPIEVPLALRDSYKIGHPSHGLIVTNAVLNMNSKMFNELNLRRDFAFLLNYIKRQHGVLSVFDKPSSAILPPGVLPQSYYMRNSEKTISPENFKSKTGKKTKIRLLYPMGIFSQSAVDEINRLFEMAGFEVSSKVAKGKALLQPVLAGEFDVFWYPYQGVIPDPDGFREFFARDSVLGAAKMPVDKVRSELDEARFVEKSEDRIGRMSKSIVEFEELFAMVPFSLNEIPVVVGNKIKIPKMDYTFHFDLNGVELEE